MKNIERDTQREKSNKERDKDGQIITNIMKRDKKSNRPMQKMKIN